MMAARRCRPTAPRRCVSRGSPGSTQLPRQRIACARLLLRAVPRTHDERSRAASSHALIGLRELGRVLAAAFLAGEWEPDAMAARGRAGAGAPGVAAARRRRGARRLRTGRRATGRASSRAYIAIVLGGASARAARGARAARADLPSGDGPRAVAGAADRHRRRAGGAPRARPRPARVAGRRRGLERTAADERCATTRYVRVPRASGPAARDRAPEGAAEGDPALDPARAPGLDPGPRRRARVRPRAARRARMRARTSGGAWSSGSISRTSSPRCPPARVYGIFRTAGYPEAVAHTLTGLCTNVVPDRRVGRRASGSPAAWPRRTCRRARRPRPRWPTSPPTGSTVASRGRIGADATRATPTTSCSPPTTTCARLRPWRRHRARRGLPRQRAPRRA